MVGHFSALLLLCHFLQFGLELESIRLGESRPHACAGEGLCPVLERGGKAASRVCTRVIDTSQTRSMALIGCDPEWWILAYQITATRWSHRQCGFFHS